MIFEIISAVLIGLMAAEIFLELSSQEHIARKLVTLAVTGEGQFSHLSNYCQNSKKPKPATKTYYKGVMECSTHLYWKNPQGWWQEVCETKPRHPHTRPLRWFKVETRCTLSWKGPKPKLNIIHWQEKS